MLGTVDGNGSAVLTADHYDLSGAANVAAGAHLGAGTLNSSGIGTLATLAGTSRRVTSTSAAAR